jgi:sucrose synthase
MIKPLPALLRSHREPAYVFFRHLIALDRRFLGWSDLVHAFESFVDTPAGAALADSDLLRILRRTQQAVVVEPLLYLAVRERVARWRYIEIHTHEMKVREIEAAEYLDAKERMVLRRPWDERYVLEVDLSPFERGFPKISDPADIGRGSEFLNRHLSRRLWALGPDGPRHLFDFLRSHHANGHPPMVGDVIGDADELGRALEEAVTLLSEVEDEGDGWIRELSRLGFGPGWGRKPGRALDTMILLRRVLNDPDPEELATFLERIPMIFSIVIVSPHGYFGQANVLGKPDTGGQVVYILDQVRALEQSMRDSIYEQGLDVRPRITVITRLIPEAEDTSCNQRVERILGTRNARILRIPFRDAHGEIVREWTSRFEIWPYLERFAVDAEREILAELGHRPDMVVGNYSDGNLVASILAHRLGVTQCTIAHALEKTKYRNSDLRWKKLDDEYHFACQFTADLISMNTADFIISSTYQEIAGTDESIGQYESYQSFTLPGLYRVVKGIDCFDPKFNVVSPGADPDVFFPYTQDERRLEELKEEITEMVFGDAPCAHRGAFADPEKPLLFAMSRLDPIKNATGLLEWYAASEELQEEANLLLVGGTLDPDASTDRDERREVERTHQLLDENGLASRVRWLEMQTDKNKVGGLYRLVADTRGAFVQPALFEAFGLTVVEAMSSGLPVFATRYGGPLEIIEDGVSGFHIDPTAGDEAAGVMAGFLQRCQEDPGEWTRISEGAMARVEERYTWRRYAHRLLRFSKIYGFWRHISSLEREETRRYLEMFYGLMYRPLAKQVARAPRKRERRAAD